jgi:hypothetical protein
MAVLLITLHFLWTGEVYEFPTPDPVPEEECVESIAETAARFTQDGVEAKVYCVAVDLPAGVEI